MRRKGSLVLAGFLILLGVYLLLNELGVNIPSGDVIWPVFPLAGGLALLAGHILGWRRDPGRVFLGTAATLVGAAFFFITLGPLEYTDLDDWWPVFILIGGVAFLAQWAATRFHDWGTLFLGMVALIIGSAGLIAALELLGPETSQTLPKLWPILLVVMGLMMLLRTLLPRRS
ncbi:MAG: hypothetical protein JXA14_15260 [Anaerolineae bacterium]|nr:hypothetical protein [Anaerolineae bacterium]